MKMARIAAVPRFNRGIKPALLLAAWVIWISPHISPILIQGDGIARGGFITALTASPMGEKAPDDQGARPLVDLSLTRARFYKLRVDPRTNQPVVELLNEESTRILRIWIGLNEAIAIEMETRKIEPLRPMTHDLMVNIIKGLGARVNQVVIHDLRASTYYAYISLSMGDQSYTVDSRPSDAIALSLRVDAPIYVASRIFSDYGIEASRGVVADELKDMLGVDVQELTPELVLSFGLKKTGGVLVAGVEAEGKAAAGGLKRGDVILEAGGEPVADMATLAARVKAMAIKGPISLKVHREGKELELTLRP